MLVRFQGREEQMWEALFRKHGLVEIAVTEMQDRIISRQAATLVGLENSAAAICPWVQSYDPQQQVAYYLNTDTSEVRYDKPATFCLTANEPTMFAALKIQRTFRAEMGRDLARRRAQGKRRRPPPAPGLEPAAAKRRSGGPFRRTGNNRDDLTRFFEQFEPEKLCVIDAVSWVWVWCAGARGDWDNCMFRRHRQTQETQT